MIASISRSAGTRSATARHARERLVGARPALLGEPRQALLDRREPALDCAREGVVEGDAPTRGGDHLGDPAAHLPRPDDEHVFERPRRRTLPFALWTSGWQRAATPKASPARKSAHGKRPTGTSSPAAELERGGFIRAGALAGAPGGAAAGVDDVRGRRRRGDRRRGRAGLRLGRPEPRRARDRRALRDLRSPGRVGDRRRPRADRARRARATRRTTTRRRSGCSRTTRARGVSTRPPAGGPTARRKPTNAGACARRRCATARAGGWCLTPRPAARARRSARSGVRHRLYAPLPVHLGRAFHSGSHSLKPPRKAFALLPRRQFGGSSSSRAAPPPPSTM